MEVEGEVARVCSEILLGFEVGGECDEMEAEDTDAGPVVVFSCVCAVAVFCEEDDDDTLEDVGVGPDAEEDGGGAGATTLANERPFIL